ncbi:MAG: N-acetyltransferase [Glaciecola sp.]|jgi:predicted N-acetyltransferase YhbS|nr:N-acetyltransferase [Glaciecola sp.]MDG1816403.1 N-acetyltransferase [Glaciecola sp.]MDG2098482.1 N-acetyltransferase [Glaciecola sp.]
MKYWIFNDSNPQKVITLFKDVFTASEGENEGQIISDFVTNLIKTTQPQDLIILTAEEQDNVIGSLCFSRFTVPGKQVAFILSPVAIASHYQGQGIGQKLIQYGLDHLRSKNVSLAFTYGDPSYYSKIGFEQINESIVKAPCPLSMPEGWLAQSLNGQKIQPMSGNTQCVEALNDPSLW